MIVIRYNEGSILLCCAVQPKIRLLLLLLMYAFRDGSGSSDPQHLIPALELLTNLPCTLYYHVMIIKWNVNPCISICKDFVTDISNK